MNLFNNYFYGVPLSFHVFFLLITVFKIFDQWRLYLIPLVLGSEFYVITNNFNDKCLSLLLRFLMISPFVVWEGKWLFFLYSLLEVCCLFLSWRKRVFDFFVDHYIMSRDYLEQELLFKLEKLSKWLSENSMVEKFKTFYCCDIVHIYAVSTKFRKKKICKDLMITWSLQCNYVTEYLIKCHHNYFEELKIPFYPNIEIIKEPFLMFDRAGIKMSKKYLKIIPEDIYLNLSFDYAKKHVRQGFSFIRQKELLKELLLIEKVISTSKESLFLNVYYFHLSNIIINIFSSI